MSVTDPEALVPAATVILLRNAKAQPGVETLMLRRNSKIAFGGAWVFPGGRVEEADALAAAALAGAELFGSSGALPAARVAAAREAQEEAGLEVSASLMIPWSFWVPPLLASIPTAGPRRRFSTWFFVAAAPPGQVRVDGSEIHDYQWLSIEDALLQQRDKAIELVPPTFVTLSQLRGFDSVDSVLAHAARTEPAEFRTEPLDGKPKVLVWSGDSEHSSARPAESKSGPARHRVTLDRGGWKYERDY